MLETKVQIDKILKRVEAAQKLQEAGQDNDAKNILIILAEDILKKIKKVN